MFPIRGLEDAISKAWLTIASAGAGVATFCARRARSTGRKLQEQHAHFLAATEASQDAFYIFDSVRDSQGRITDFAFRYLSPGAERRWNRSQESLVGKRLRAEFPALMSDALFASYCELVESGTPRLTEFPVSDPALPSRWLRHYAIKLGDGIALSSTDLTHLKSIETRYREIVEFSDSIFENAPFSILATDGAGTITAMNAQAEGTTGYAREELIGKRSMLSLHDPEELRQRAEQVAHELETPISDFDLLALPRNGGESEWTYIRRDGTRSPVALAVQVLRSPSGERSGMIAIAQDITSRRQMMSYATHMLSRDPLTGLVGRPLLEDRMYQAIERAKRAGTKVAAFLIDLDSFKRINDSFGHRIGDEILMLAATRLLEAVRSSDTVARMGGDEFVVLMPDLNGDSAVEFCADRLIRVLSQPYMIHEQRIILTASLGYCIFPDIAASADHLLQRIDSAMHAAKQKGRNRFQIFTAEMLQDASPRLSMEGALRLALDNEEFYLHYQPQVALPSGRVIGMEALLRWKHPKLGLVSPAHFIPMAEEMGLMPQLGEWVIQQACKTARQLQNELGRSLLLSVNISPRQFQKRLVKIIEDALHESGLSPRDLEIEITENTLMINSTANLEMLQSIRDLGVRLSIDDFGTGFSSFSYLLQYQIDRLKIDQSFVRQAMIDANAAAVVRTIIAMSHNLDIKVIAEGAETREQLKFLLRRRCDEVQGYYFAKPVPSEQFLDTVAQIESMQVEELAVEVGVGTEQPPTGAGAEALRDLDDAADYSLRPL